MTLLVCSVMCNAWFGDNRPKLGYYQVTTTATNNPISSKPPSKDHFIMHQLWCYIMWCIHQVSPLSGWRAASLPAHNLNSTFRVNHFWHFRDTSPVSLSIEVSHRNSCTDSCLSPTCPDLSSYPAQKLKQWLMLTILSHCHKGLPAVHRPPDAMRLFFLLEQTLPHVFDVMFIKCTVHFSLWEERPKEREGGGTINKSPHNKRDSQSHTSCSC